MRGHLSDTGPNLPTPAQQRAGFQRLLFVLLAGALAQILIRVQDWNQNPFSRIPRVDAAHNWEWAGRIAQGELVGDAPFFGAPLAPYVAGLLRYLGGDLLAWQMLSSLALVGAAALVGRAVMRAFGGAVAPALAAGLVLFTTDCAHAPGRVLSGSLQLFLMGLLLDRAVALVVTRDTRRALLLGAVVGCTTLVWPVMLPLTGLLALWAGWLAGRGAGMGVFLTAALFILPATVHNYAASGDLIPVTAHAGVTFYHGNNPGADGTITGSGLSMDKAAHQREALEETRSALGPEAGWSKVSGHFFSRGFAWWQAEPSRALGLALRKGAMFLGGRHYGDIDLVTLERGEVASALWLAPIPSQFVVGLGLLAGVWGLRKNLRRFLPALLLVLAALGVVLVFWYTPRYRLPVVPAASFLVAGAIAMGVMTRRVWILCGVFLMALSWGVERIGWDDAGRWRGGFHLALAQAHRELGDDNAASVQALLAQEQGEQRAAILLAELMGGQDGLRVLVDLADRRPEDGNLQRRLAIALAQGGDLPGALVRFEQAADLDPLDWRARQGWGATLLQTGALQRAVEVLGEAQDLAPHEPDVLYTQGLVAEAMDDSERALALAQETLLYGPSHQPARDLLVRQLLVTGQKQELIQVLEAWIAETPELWPARSLCAWLLATDQDKAVRDGARALALLEGHFPLSPEPDALDTLAAAQAAAGDFEGARKTILRALELSKQWPEEMRGGLLRRQAAYGRGEAWIEAP